MPELEAFGTESERILLLIAFLWYFFGEYLKPHSLLRLKSVEKTFIFDLLSLFIRFRV